MSESRKGNNNGMYGRTHNQETRMKISLKAIGRKRRLGAILSDETKDKIRLSLGNQTAGANNPRNKITSDLLAMVLLLLSQGVSQLDIGKSLGISQTTVSKIKLEKTYLQKGVE